MGRELDGEWTFQCDPVIRQNLDKQDVFKHDEAIATFKDMLKTDFDAAVNHIPYEMYDIDVAIDKESPVVPFRKRPRALRVTVKEQSSTPARATKGGRENEQLMKGTTYLYTKKSEPKEEFSIDWNSSQQKESLASGPTGGSSGLTDDSRTLGSSESVLSGNGGAKTSILSGLLSQFSRR